MSTNIEDLIARLEDPDIEVRRRAIFMMRHDRNPSVMAAIRKALEDNSIEVQGEALRTLALMKDDSILDKCIVLIREGNEEQQQFAIVALGTLASTEALAYLEKLFASTDEDKSLEIAYMLARNQNRAGERILLSATKREDDWRLISVACLAAFGHKGFMSELKRLIQHGTEHERNIISLVFPHIAGLGNWEQWEGEALEWIDHHAERS